MRLFIMAACALALAGCAAMGAVGSIASAINSVASVAGRPATPDQSATVVKSSTVSDVVVLRGSQGLLVANNGYQAATAFAKVYVRSGRATAAELDRIVALNDRAVYLLEGGGAGLGAARRAAEVMNIVAELNLFKGR